MSEGFGTDLPSGRALQTVVPNGRRGTQGAFDIARLKQIALLRRLGPHAGEAIGLQFQTDG